MFKITVVLSALAVYCIQIASAVGGFGYPGAVGLYSGGFGGPKFGGEGLEGGGKFGAGFGGAGYGIEGPKIGYGLQGPKIGGIGYGGLEGPKIGGIGYGGLEGPKLGGAGGFGYGPAKFTPVQGFEAGGAKFGGAGYGGPVALPVPKYGGYGVAGGLGGGYGGGIGQEKVAISYAGPLVHEKISVGGYGGEGLGFGGVKYGGLGGAGAGVGLGGPKLGLGYGGAVGGLGPVGHVGYGGGEILSKGEFSEGKKGINDAQFHAASGKKGEEFEEGQKGFKLGKAAEKNVKGDSGFYSGEEAGKKLAEDEKAYHGSKHYAQEGKNGAEKKVKQGHKKGHVIKGFKSSHHKDESGKTEEFYDEEHDEGEHASADGHSGSFGEGSAASFKGAHEDSDFKANQGGQKGGYEKEHLIDGNNGGGSQFSSKKFGGEDSNFGYKKGADEESVLGHKDSTKYFKHLPFHHGGF